MSCPSLPALLIQLPRHRGTGPVFNGKSFISPLLKIISLRMLLAYRISSKLYVPLAH
jgi:hypothetical protein